MPEGGVDIYEATNGTGYVVTAQSKGYGGMLKVMVGIDSNGVITGTEVLENNETQGLGSKVSEHAFMDQYIGKDSNLEGLETISGTTISSMPLLRPCAMPLPGLWRGSRRRGSWCRARAHYR